MEKVILVEERLIGHGSEKIESKKRCLSFGNYIDGFLIVVNLNNVQFFDHSS